MRPLHIFHFRNRISPLRKYISQTQNIISYLYILQKHMKNKYTTFIIFIFIIIFRTTFFNWYKFYTFSILGDTLNPTLQTIAGYLSLGSIFAYLLWWAIAYTFQKRVIVLIASILTIASIILGHFIWYNNIRLAIVVSSVWFFYWVWVIVRNVLVAVEIEKTWMQDTTVNAIVSIFFIAFLIVWAIVGWLLFEKLWNQGIWVLVAMLVIACVLAIFLKYRDFDRSWMIRIGYKKYFQEKWKRFVESMKDYLPNIKHIFQNYATIIVSASFLRAITTIVSQKIIEHSMMNFDKTTSEASVLLLFSAVWAIIWNAISMKMQAKRWMFFRIFTYAFALCVLVIPFVWTSYNNVVIIAVICWIFFWASSNLIEWFFFRKVWENDEKEYGASVYGLVLSVVLFGMTVFSNLTDKLWAEWFFYLSAFMILGIGLYIRMSLKKLVE